MGRNSRHRQQAPSSSQHNDLLNFQFSTPAVQDNNVVVGTSGRHPRSFSSQDRGRNNGNHSRRNSSSNNNNGRNSVRNSNRRSAQDRASARRKADSSMFYLHSSAEHSFVLTRRSPSKVHQELYSFNGVDANVSWESVRMVEQRLSLRSANKCNVATAASSQHDEDDASPSCPICLCNFVCARITKCGHSFCLPCIVRHVQTYTANNPYHHVKCPCCGIPVVVDDLRPISFSMVLPPTLHTKFRLRKLHRHRNASAPYLPLVDAPMHGNPHFAPTAGVDADAAFSRFQFVDPDRYHAFLVENQVELQREISSTIDNTEKIYLSMALEMVLAQQQRAQEEHEEEEAIRARFANPAAGMYQPQSPALSFSKVKQSSGTDEFFEREEITGENDTSATVPASLDESPDNTRQQRHRGNSISSHRSVESGTTFNSQHSGSDCLMTLSPGGSKPRGHRKKFRPLPQGSMYLDGSNTVHFYQSEDGQLVFMNGFNMACLSSDYTKSLPSALEDGGNSENAGDDTIPRPPFPDFIDGRVLEIETVCLTPDVRKRMPFLSHIPLYTDVVLVELDLNHALTEETREKFKGDIAKRRKRRQSKLQAEKRADKAALREEMELIKERKARLQIIDPNDDFFQIPSLPVDQSLGEGGDFGPALGAENDTSEPQANSQAPLNPELGISFSDALRRGNDSITISSTEAFPALGSLAESFPALGGSLAHQPTVEKPATIHTILAPSSVSALPVGKKKKKKGQQVVLFSTGGARGF
ncbi:zinc finger C3HC4 type domain containing protein [Nitzschia inconspicua]|uniref:Zinc finger C3HC4 type domain containing protein n=1 Tax=Nitzschia inconspicua TaxID=303405 RepID=A0A9K3PX32_9STRA|nr:zinc finger C3HC4 type domain containing protein [Nitzschia inconspicua]